MGSYVVAVDLGGTSCKLGLVDQAGQVHTRLTIPTPNGAGEDAILDAIVTGIHSILQQSGKTKNEMIGIGLGTPGYLDKSSGIVTHAPNIGWINYPAKQKLEEKTGKSVSVDNDANLAAIGEMWQGAGRGAKNLIMVTLGTGVGGGIIINGEVVGGVNGIGGEIGHITINPEGVRCGCGKLGCLETESSATAIIRKTQELLKGGKASSMQSIWLEKGVVTPKDVAEAALAGDSLALQIYDRVAFYLALALAGLIQALNPEKLIIGGGVAFAGWVLFEPLQNYIRSFTLKEAYEVLKIESAELGNDAGMLGAAYIALQAYSN